MIAGYFDTRDRVYLTLRFVAWLMGMAHALTAPAPLQLPLLICFACFAAYSLVLYSLFGKAQRLTRGQLYAALFALDYLLIAALMFLTGGAASPFYRALYLWIAMAAFYFGRRAGVRASLCGFVLFLAFHVLAGFVGDPWVIAAQGAGLLVHGPIIGMLVSSERLRSRAMALQNREMEQERDLLRAVLETTGALVVLLDPSGRLVKLNRAAETITGLRTHAAVGRFLWELLPAAEGPPARARLQQLVRDGRPQRHEHTLRTVSGEECSIAWADTLLVDALGRPHLIVKTGIDISEQERTARALQRAHDELAVANRQLAEEQNKLVQAEKLSSIGLLAAGVAHEINNPLAGITACISALKEDRVTPEGRPLYYETVLDGLERIGGTVKGLLDFARQRPAELGSVDLGEVVEGCAKLIKPALRAKAIRLQQSLPQELQLQADRSQLMQAIMNLLLNAVHAVAHGGRVRLTLRRRQGFVGLCIEDNGPGIPKDLLGRVCDPFFSTKPEGSGTGLGLAVTQSIMRAHGGELAIESAPQKGTAVTLWLPAVEDRCAPLREVG